MGHHQPLVARSSGRIRQQAPFGDATRGIGLKCNGSDDCKDSQNRYHVSGESNGAWSQQPRHRRRNNHYTTESAEIVLFSTDPQIKLAKMYRIDRSLQAQWCLGLWLMLVTLTSNLPLTYTSKVEPISTNSVQRTQIVSLPLNLIELSNGNLRISNDTKGVPPCNNNQHVASNSEANFEKRDEYSVTAQQRQPTLSPTNSLETQLAPMIRKPLTVDTIETAASKKKMVKKKKKMEKKHKEWKKGKKHKKKKYESKKKKGGSEKKKKGKKEKKKWGMEKKGHNKKGNFKKKKWGQKKKMKKGQKKGKKGHKMLKDKGHKKKGFKKVYHKEEWGKKKKWHDIKREKKWNTKQKKWKKKWHQEKGKKYKGKHMKKYHKKNKHGKKYKKEKKSKWKKHKGEKFKKGHKKKKEEYSKKKEGGKKKKMKKMKKEMKKKKKS